MATDMSLKSLEDAYREVWAGTCDPSVIMGVCTNCQSPYTITKDMYHGCRHMLQYFQGVHYCETPRVDNADLNYGDEWTCPDCHKVWTLTVDEVGECSAYWDDI